MERSRPACRPRSRWLPLCVLPVFLILCLSLLAHATPASAASLLTYNEWTQMGIPNGNWGYDVDHAYATDTSNFNILVVSTPLTLYEVCTVSIYDSNGKYLMSITSTPDPGGTFFYMGTFQLISDYRLQAGYAAAIKGEPWTIKVYDLHSGSFIESCSVYVNYNGYGGGGGGGVWRTPTSISASPNPVSVLKGGTQQLGLQENFSSGNPVDITGTGLYTSADTSKVTVSSPGGLITGEAETTTPVVVTINWDGLTTTDRVTVYTVTSLTASPNPMTLPVGETQQLAVTAYLSNGGTQDVTADSGYQASSSYATISPTGLITAGSTVTPPNEPDDVSVSYDGFQVTVPVTVTNPVTGISASFVNGKDQIPRGASLQLTVTANQIVGSFDITDSASYQVSDPTVASVSSTGLVTGIEDDSGAYPWPYVTISYDGFTTTAEFMVGPPCVISIAASPPSVTVPVNGTQQLTVTATMSDGTTENVTSNSNFTFVDNGLTDDGIANLSKPSTNQASTTMYYPSADSNGMISTALGHPSNTGGGSSAFMTAISLGVPRPSENGCSLVTGEAAGSTYIKINYYDYWWGSYWNMPVGGFTATVPVTVINPVSSIAVDPPSIDLPAGDTQQLTVTATMSNKSTADVTSSASYGDYDSSVINVSSGGLVTCVTKGSTSITVSFGGQTTTVPVTVTAPVVASIAAIPPSIDLPAGDTQQLTVTVTMSDNSTADVTSSANYVSDATSIASVFSGGLVDCIAEGGANVTVSYGGQTTTVPVTVTAPVVSFIMVNPPSIDLPAGQKQQLTVTAIMTDGATADVTSSASYSSGGDSIATVSDGGLVDCVAQGSTNVTVSYGYLSITVPVTVESGPAQTFSVTYYGNGKTSGSAPIDSTAYTAGEQVVVKDAGDLLRTDYTFIGWNTQEDDSGNKYNAGDTFIIEADTNLYAMWSGGHHGVESFPILSAKPSYFEQL